VLFVGDDWAKYNHDDEVVDDPDGDCLGRGLRKGWTGCPACMR
jgi:hypothetical protein